MADLFAHGNKLLPSTDKYIVRIFNIPAISIRDEQGNIDKERPSICLEAPEICKEICYAYRRQKGREKIVYGGREKNYRATLDHDFVYQMQQRIRGTIKYYQRREVQIIYRIHESGDFYSTEYLQKWVAIADLFKDQGHVRFMAYTKNIELLNQYLKMKGFRLKDINIKFKYSVMQLREYEGKIFKNTFDQQEKLAVAEELRKQGLTYYTLYASDEDLPQETKQLKICRLHEGSSCSDCGMKCYLDDCDIAAVAR